MHKTPQHLHPRWSFTLFLALAAGAVMAAAPLATGQLPLPVKAGFSGAQATPQPAKPAALPQRAPRNRALDRRIDKILAGSDARRGWWGIEVMDLASDKLLYQRDADHLYIPASNMKMFTTAGALENLGPGYVFRTTVESAAEPDSWGRVEDLYLVGRGDANLGARTFPYSYHGPQQPADTFLQDLADQLKARGVREVTRKLIADDSYFVYEPFAPNWAADDLEWGYGAPVTALAFNDNLLTLHVKPGGKPGDEAAVLLSPVPDYYRLKNQIRTGDKGTPVHYLLERQPGSMELDLWGQIPIDSGESTETVALANPPQLVAELFRTALRARGIVVDGPIEVHHFTSLEATALPNPAPSSPPRVVLAQHTSPPLSEAIKVINKESENLHAELLLRTLGRVMNNQGSLEGGLKALNAFTAQQVGIMSGETCFVDGSGLSREDLVTPNAAVELLRYMAHSPHFQEFFHSLPVSGIDGTLAHRLFDDEVKGRIHAKTGSVEHVNTLSGYMDLPSGKRLAFSIMANHHAMANKAGQEILDAITLEICRAFSTRE